MNSTDEILKETKTVQVTLRLRPSIIEALDHINRTKYGGLRSRASLMDEALWRFGEYHGYAWNEHA